MATNAINFGASDEDFATIRAIVERAAAVVERYTGQPWLNGQMLNLHLDIMACHLNGNPLRLADILAADDLQFTHDVFGIREHLDRMTGQLKDSWTPRFSV